MDFDAKVQHTREKSRQITVNGFS